MPCFKYGLYDLTSRLLLSVIIIGAIVLGAVIISATLNLTTLTPTTSTVGTTTSTTTTPTTTTTTTGPVTSELRLKVGETAKTKVLEVTVLSVSKTSSISYYSRSLNMTITHKADSQKVLIVLDVEIRNVGQDKLRAGADTFSVFGSQGFRYESKNLGFSFLGGEGFLDISKELFPGERIRGKVVFEVPETASGLRVLFDFTSFNVTVRFASWSIPD